MFIAFLGGSIGKASILLFRRLAGSSLTQGGRLVADARDQQPFEPGEWGHESCSPRASPINFENVPCLHVYSDLLFYLELESSTFGCCRKSWKNIYAPTVLMSYFFCHLWKLTILEIKSHNQMLIRKNLPFEFMSPVWWGDIKVSTWATKWYVPPTLLFIKSDKEKSGFTFY